MKLADFDVFQPSKGFRVLVHPTGRFKTLSIVAYVHRPLGDAATVQALLPFVLRRGCRGLPDMRKIVVHLESLFGASFSADVVKLGERQILSFRMDVVNDRFAPRKIKALEKSLQFLWRILALPVTAKGGLRPDYVSQEKENLRRLIEGMINDRMTYAYERCIQEMCREEAYSRYEYGRTEEIEPVTPRQLKDVHAKVLAESPVDLFISGDVEPDRAAALAGRIFKFRNRRVRTIRPAEVREGGGPLREHVERLEVDQGKVVLGCRTGVRWGDPDTFPLVFYNGLLGAFPHSKLFAQVREKEGLAYACHSSLDHSKGLLFVTAGIDPEKYARCVEVVRAQMDEVAAGRYGEDEWEKTRLTLIDRIRSREDSPGSKIAAFLEMDLNGGPMTGEQVISAIGRVTREDVSRAAARVKPDTLFFLTRP
jgi:predicted Zn-dependent peptidase